MAGNRKNPTGGNESRFEDWDNALDEWDAQFSSLLDEPKAAPVGSPANAPSATAEERDRHDASVTTDQPAAPAAHARVQPITAGGPVGDLDVPLEADIELAGGAPDADYLEMPSGDGGAKQEAGEAVAFEAADDAERSSDPMADFDLDWDDGGDAESRPAPEEVLVESPASIPGDLVLPDELAAMEDVDVEDVYGAVVADVGRGAAEAGPFALAGESANGRIGETAVLVPEVTAPSGPPPLQPPAEPAPPAGAAVAKVVAAAASPATASATQGSSMVPVCFSAPAPRTSALPADAEAPTPRLPSRPPIPTLSVEAPQASRRSAAAPSSFDLFTIAREHVVAPAERAALDIAAAYAAEREGDTIGARAAFERALTEDPTARAALHGLRRLSLRSGDVRGAISAIACEERVAAGPARPALAVLRGELLLGIDAPDEARQAFRVAAEEGSPSLARLWARAALVDVSVWQGREGKERSLLAEDVGEPVLRAALCVEAGRRLEREADDAGAAACFREALASDGGSSSAALGLLRTARRSGHVEDERLALERLAACWNGPQGNAARRRQALLFMAPQPGAARQPERAIAILQPLDDVPSLELRLRAEEAAGQSPLVEATLAQLADRSRGEARADRLLALAAMHEQHGDNASARSLVERALEAAPSDPRAHAALDRLAPPGARDAGRLPAGDDPIARRQRAAIHLEQGRLEEAEAALAGAHPERPGAAGARRDLVALLLGAGRAREAAILLGRAAQAHRDDDRLGADLLGLQAARLYLECGARDDALAQIRNLQGGAFEGEARQLLLRLAADGAPEGLAEVPDALEAQAAEAPESRLSAALLWRRGALLESEAPGGAVAAWRHALELDPDQSVALLSLELIGESDTAAAGYLELAERAHGMPAMASALRAAAVLERGGDSKAAVEAYQHALAASAGGAAIPINDHLLRLARAAGDRSVEEKLATEVEGDADVDTRLRALVRRAERSEREGRFDDALGFLREAHSLRPTSLLIQDAIDRTLLAAGRLSELDERIRAQLDDSKDVATRVHGYERLARLEAEHLGNQEGAVALYHSILENDHAHHPAFRALERYYEASERDSDLVHLYDQMGLTANDPRLAIAVILERARLRERLGGEPADIENDLRQALFKDGRSRPVLRRLVVRSRHAGEANALGEMCARLAELYEGRGAASAAFLAVGAFAFAGEERRVEAIARYRAALGAAGLQSPWLRRILQLVLLEDDPKGIVEVGTMAAGAYRDPTERVRAGLVAGARAERAGDIAAAITAFRGVLADEPAHPEAFERACALLEAQGDRARHAEVLFARAAVESDDRRAADLLVRLSGMYVELGQTSRAKEALAQALSRVAGHGPALGALADLHESTGAWPEAADALIRRLRIEKDPAAVRDGFFRLGMIYDGPLPDAERAIVSFGRVLQADPENRVALEKLRDLYLRTGDHKNALSVLGRLARLETDVALRIPLLLQAARIQSESLRDYRSAVEVLKRALALDPLHVETIAALAALYQRQSDLISERVLLDTSLQQLRQAAARRPLEPAPYHALFGLFRLRRSHELALVTAELLKALGAASPDEERLLRENAARDASALAHLAAPEIDDALYHPGVPPGFRHLFRLLDETLQKAFRGDLKRFGVGRGDRLPKTHPARAAAAKVSIALGVPEPEIYLSREQPKLLGIDLTEPLSIVIGEGLAGLSQPELVFCLARLLKPVQSGLAVPLRMSPDELGVLVGAIVRQFVHDYVPAGFDGALVAQEAARLSRVMPRKQHAELMTFAFECAAPQLDWRAIAGLLSHSANRAGLLAVGALAPALSALRRMDDEAQLHELLRFAVSEDLAELRRLAGVALG